MKSRSYKKTFLFALVAALVVWGVGQRITLPSSARQTEPREINPDMLKKTKLEESKRQFRLSERKTNDPASPLPSLLALYDDNQFQAVSDQIVGLSDDRKNAPLHLLHGNALAFLGKHEEAAAAYQQAYRKAETPQEQAAALANFGLLFSTKRVWKEGITWTERALAIDRQTGDRQAEGADLALLGTLYYQAGDTAKGSEAHMEALKIAESISDRRLMARQLASIGNLHYLDRSYETALDYQQKALKLYRELGNPIGEAVSLTSLSFIYKDRKDFAKALAFQSDALAIHQAGNDLSSQANSHINLALIHQDQGELEKAIGSAEKALKIREEMNDLPGMANVEGTIGTIHQSFGESPPSDRTSREIKRALPKGGASQQIHIVDQRIQTLRDQMQN
ncbi:MAG: tetratricopeptide repeat protein [Candidatus Manganitrophus sp.]|nr:tetratricopeptide repeat protein [Candidatus Manganitrophus sp.]